MMLDAWDDPDIQEPDFLSNCLIELQCQTELAAKDMKTLVHLFDRIYGEIRTKFQKGRWEARHKEIVSSMQKKQREVTLLEAKIEKLQVATDTLRAERDSLQSTVADEHDEIVTLSQESHEKNELHSRLSTEMEKTRIETTKTFQAVIRIKQMFTTWLGCHVRLESSEERGDVYLLSFIGSCTNQQNKQNVYAKLLCDRNGLWYLLETQPHLQSFRHVADKLKNGQDISGCIAFIREQLLN